MLSVQGARDLWILSGKATAKFPLDQPIPYSLLERIVRFRVQENLAKADRMKN